MEAVMQFKEILNEQTGGGRYYIDGVRVSFEKFDDLEQECKAKGMKYNTSCYYTEGKNHINIFHLD